MTHANAPLSVEGRRRLIERCKTRPIAHVAAEMGISRACASKWVNRWRKHGHVGLLDRSSTPRCQPIATEPVVVQKIEAMRRGPQVVRVADRVRTQRNRCHHQSPNCHADPP